MILYVISKKQGNWPNGSSEPMVRKCCAHLNIKDDLVYEAGKPVFVDSKHFISVSHSAHLMIIAFSDQPIGIDIEKNRTLSNELIERLKLEPKDPLLDWCQREATSKLMNNPDYLFKKAPLDAQFIVCDVADGFTCVLASLTPPHLSKIIHYDEHAL